MPSLQLALCDTDLVAGVAKINNSSPTFLIVHKQDGSGFFDAAAVADTVQSHGTGAHANATMSTGSSFFKTHTGRGFCRNGDAATCGDTVVASGLITVVE